MHVHGNQRSFKDATMDERRAFARRWCSQVNCRDQQRDQKWKKVLYWMHARKLEVAYWRKAPEESLKIYIAWNAHCSMFQSG